MSTRMYDKYRLAVIPATELRVGDEMVYASVPDGFKTVTEVKLLYGPVVRVAFADGRTGKLTATCKVKLPRPESQLKEE